MKIMIYRSLLMGMFLATFMGMLLATPGFGQSLRRDAVLESRLQALAKPFNGTVGIYVQTLRTGRFAAVNPDSLFPTASMIKVPIMAGLFDKIQKGEIKYHDSWTYKDSLLYAGEDLLGSFKDGEKISVSKVAMLMITTSDNTASLWCQLMAGTGTAINALMQQSGFEHTRVNSRTPGREAMRRIYGWGVTTPREMTQLMIRIRQGNLISPAVSEEMYRNLTRIYWNDEALSQIPPTIQVASKQGAVDRSRSETVLVNAPSGDYAFTVITKNQADTRWVYANEGFVLLRQVSALLWRYFEPKHPWKPSEGMKLFWD